MYMQMHMYMYMCACARVFVGGYVLLINWLNKSWWCTWHAISSIDSLEVAEATDCCIGYSWFVRFSHGPCCSIYFLILPQRTTPRINGHCPTPRLGFRENPGEKFSLLQEYKPYGFRWKDVTLWWTNIAIENGHRHSGFSHETWWIFPIVM